jgi:hypothetical protein
MHEVFMRSFGGRARRKEPIGITRRRWEDKNRNVVRDQDMGKFWIQQAQYRDQWWALVNGIISFMPQRLYPEERGPGTH